MSTYADFLARKAGRAPRVGHDVDVGDVHSLLHPWQRDLVAWAVGVGRAALWADTGLGKTLMQLEWARLSGDRVLVVAPLAVCAQTVREADKVDVDARYLRADDSQPGIVVTNYEMTERFDASTFDAVVLDESSILKDVTSKTRDRLIEQFAVTPRRLACTATPAPNDAAELANHAEFLGVATRREMLSTYFVHDQDGWRPKGHAREPMYAWMATWAAAVRRPSDLGYPDDGYVLPGLSIVPHLVPANVEPAEGDLFPSLGGVSGRAKVRRSTLTRRVVRTVDLVRDCGSQGVQRGVLPSQPGEVEAVPRGSRTPECSTPEALRGECRAPGAAEGPEQGVSAAAAVAASSGAVRPDSGRSGADAGPRVPGVRSEACSGPDRQDAHRPRPQDGHGPRCSLSAVQPGTRTPGRRPDQGDGDVRLPHACRDQWLIWCGLNDEQDALAAALGDEAVSIDGRTSHEDKVEFERRWREGEVRVLITKPVVMGWGMNWQHCARMAFVGLSDSYEAYYQSIRRCYRYGQTREVQAHIVLSDLEQGIAVNVQRKEETARQFTAELVEAMRATGTWRASA